VRRTGGAGAEVREDLVDHRRLGDERDDAHGAVPPDQTLDYRGVNTLAESILGLYKTEVIHRRGPWKSFDDVEYATLEWVAWFNTRRILEPLGYVSPAEFEEQFYRTQAAPAERLALN
jgi:transposase InsO family protein